MIQQHHLTGSLLTSVWLKRNPPQHHGDGGSGSRDEDDDHNDDDDHQQTKSVNRVGRAANHMIHNITGEMGAGQKVNASK